MQVPTPTCRGHLGSDRRILPITHGAEARRAARHGPGHERKVRISSRPKPQARSYTPEVCLKAVVEGKPQAHGCWPSWAVLFKIAQASLCSDLSVSTGTRMTGRSMFPCRGAPRLGLCSVYPLCY